MAQAHAGRQLRGAEAVLGWSFYSQGSKERATAADQFLNWALDKLGIKLETHKRRAPRARRSPKRWRAPGAASPRWRRAVAARAWRTQIGQLKDLGLRALLRRFAAVPPGEPHGLIVLTSRLAITDIARWKDTAAPVVDVERLSDEAGAALCATMACGAPTRS